MFSCSNTWKRNEIIDKTNQKTNKQTNKQTTNKQTNERYQGGSCQGLVEYQFYVAVPSLFFVSQLCEIDLIFALQNKKN